MEFQNKKRPWASCRTRVAVNLLVVSPLWLMAIGAVCATPRASCASDGVLPDIQRVYESQAGAFDPAWIRYQLTQFVSPQWLKNVLHRPKAPRQGETTTMHGEIAQKGPLLHYSLEVENGGSGSFLSVYDGELSISRWPPKNRYDISRVPEQTEKAPDPLVLNGEARVRRILQDWAAGRGDIRTIRAVDEKPRGAEPRVRLDVQYRNGWRNEAVLIPGRGYAVARFAVFDAERRRLEECTTTAFTEIPGGWYPQELVAVNYFTTGEIAMRRSLHVGAVTTSAADIPSGLFKVDIPTGAEVYDKDTRAFIRDSKAAQDYLDNARAYVNIRRGRSFRFLAWALPLAIGAAATGGAFLLYRRRRSAGR